MSTLITIVNVRIVLEIMPELIIIRLPVQKFYSVIADLLISKVSLSNIDTYPRIDSEVKLP